LKTLGRKFGSHTKKDSIRHYEEVLNGKKREEKGMPL